MIHQALLVCMIKSLIRRHEPTDNFHISNIAKITARAQSTGLCELYTIGSGVVCC